MSPPFSDDVVDVHDTPAPADPLEAWPAFAESVRARLEAGRAAYRDASFARPPAELVAELQQEAPDLRGGVLRCRRASPRAAGAPPVRLVGAERPHDRMGNSNINSNKLAPKLAARVRSAARRAIRSRTSPMTEKGWLAQTFAAPVIGIQTRAWLGFAPGVWTSLEQLGQKWAGDVTIQTTSAIAVKVVRSSGIYFDLSPTTITAGYTFQLAMKHRAGGLPELVSPDEIASYPELMGRVTDELCALLDAAGSVGSGRAVQRIGCVADCRLAEDAAPPGVARLLEHLGQPWPEKLKAIEASFLAELSTDGKTREQCHHVVSKNAYDRPNDLGFKLDWQRLWHTEHPMRTTELKKAVIDAAGDAARYFQRFGEGAWDNDT